MFSSLTSCLFRLLLPVFPFIYMAHFFLFSYLPFSLLVIFSSSFCMIHIYSPLSYYPYFCFSLPFSPEFHNLFLLSLLLASSSFSNIVFLSFHITWFFAICSCSSKYYWFLLSYFFPSHLLRWEMKRDDSENQERWEISPGSISIPFIPSILPCHLPSHFVQSKHCALKKHLLNRLLFWIFGENSINNFITRFSFKLLQLQYITIQREVW